MATAATRARPRKAQKQSGTLTLKQAARRAKVSPEHMRLLCLCVIEFEYTGSTRDRFEKRVSVASLNQFLEQQGEKS